MDSLLTQGIVAGDFSLQQPARGRLYPMLPLRLSVFVSMMQELLGCIA